MNAAVVEKDWLWHQTPTSNNMTHGDCLAVTPTDGVETVFAFRAVRVVTAGVVGIRTLSGIDRLCNFAAGETRYIGGTRINATGTTAGTVEIMR